MRAFLRDFARRRPRWGWRRAAKAARDAGCAVNNSEFTACDGQKDFVCYIAKRSDRFEVSVRKSARCVLSDRTSCGGEIFEFDQTSDSRMLKFSNVIDEFTRERLAMEVDRSIDADGVVGCPEQLAAER